MILYLVNMTKTQLSWPMQMLLNHNFSTVRPLLVVDLTECWVGVGGKLEFSLTNSGTTLIDTCWTCIWMCGHIVHIIHRTCKQRLFLGYICTMRLRVGSAQEGGCIYKESERSGEGEEELNL